MSRDYVFTSESVTEGHPDKMCDQISDAVVDAIIAREAELAEKARRELAVEGRMGKGYSARFNITYDAGRSELADHVLEPARGSDRAGRWPAGSS